MAVTAFSEKHATQIYIQINQINSTTVQTLVALVVQILLAVFSSLGGAASLLLLLVPVGRVPVTYPDRVVLDIGCGLQQEGYLDLGVAGTPPCNYVPSLMQGKIQQVGNGGHKQMFI